MTAFKNRYSAANNFDCKYSHWTAEVYFTAQKMKKSLKKTSFLVDPAKHLLRNLLEKIYNSF